jgi:DNA excision repair protein ERCC-6
LIFLSRAEVQTAYQCALILRNLIAPFFLRRMKKNVNIILPAKQEQVR